MLNLFNLKQLVNIPTRVTINSKSLLDHIICNCSDKVSKVGVIPVGLSDHMLTFCTRKISKRTTDSEEKVANNSVKIRSTKHYNREIFIEKLNENDWSKLYLCRNVNTAWIIFRDYFIATLNKVAPLKEVKIKIHTEPWMN